MWKLNRVQTRFWTLNCFRRDWIVSSTQKSQGICLLLSVPSTVLLKKPKSDYFFFSNFPPHPKAPTRFVQRAGKWGRRAWWKRDCNSSTSPCAPRLTRKRRLGMRQIKLHAQISNHKSKENFWETNSSPWWLWADSQWTFASIQPHFVVFRCKRLHKILRLLMFLLYYLSIGCVPFCHFSHRPPLVFHCHLVWDANMAENTVKIWDFWPT